jgi:hypothetical protein
MLSRCFIHLQKVFKLHYLTLLCVMLLIGACKKESHSEIPAADAKLFNYALIENTELKEIAEDIELNRTHTLGSGLLERNGQPLWNYAIYLNAPASNQTIVHVNGTGIKPNEAQPANGKQWLIPFTKGNSKVDAVLVCQKTGQGFYYNLITENSIKTVKPKDKNEVLNKQVILYAKLNNLVYNRTEFPEIKIKDFNLKGNSRQMDPNKNHFGNSLNGERSLVITGENIQANGRIVNALGRFCVTSNRTCNCPAEWNYCDYCYQCVAMDCADVWVPDEELEPTGDGSGGSGGGGSGQGGNGGTGAYLPVVQALASKVTLNAPQLDWLNSHQATANELLTFLLDENEITPAIDAATSIAINVQMANLLEGPYDDTYNNLVGSSIPLSVVLMQYTNQVSLNMALLKVDHPDWGFFHLYWEASKETIQTGLDVLGLFPIIGSIADVVNGSIYALNGDGTMAALSFATAVPIAGWYAAGLKAAKKTLNITATTKTALRWIRQTDNIINFGNRGQLRRVLGLVAGDARQAHHLIPWEHAAHDVVQIAAKGPNPFHMNEALNGIALAKEVHVEGVVHSIYNTRVHTALEEIAQRHGSNLTPVIARQELEGLVGKIRTWIQNNPGVNLNNIGPL